MDPPQAPVSPSFLCYDISHGKPERAISKRIRTAGPHRCGRVWRGVSRPADHRRSRSSDQVILPAYANDPEFIRRFESEANLVARLEHPHIAPLYDFWRDPERRLSRHALPARRQRPGSLRDGPYELNAASRLLDQIASALDFAHRQGVIHRDIKPGNILLDEDGNAYLADFGIAKDLAGDQRKPEAAGEIAGSPDYIAPEQAHGESVTARTDIYSLGITLYEMIAGEHPFQNSSSIERLYKHINDPVPEIDAQPDGVQDPLNEIIQKATAKNPKQRYQDALAMAAAFRDAARRNGASAAPPNSSNRLPAASRRSWRTSLKGRQTKRSPRKLFLELIHGQVAYQPCYKKLGVRSRVQAIVRARELDLIVSELNRSRQDERHQHFPSRNR